MGYTQCFEHTVRRYFPVANLTRTRQAVIVEPLRPERFFVRTFNATSLYILSICEVCGSYQCPFCSSATLPMINWSILIFLVTFTLVISNSKTDFNTTIKRPRQSTNATLSILKLMRCSSRASETESQELE